MVWRMSPYERRRGGNAPPGGSRGRPGAGNARSGQRGSGHSVATRSRYAPDTELGYAGPASWRRGEANSTASGRRVCQHRSFAPWGKARPEKWAQSRGQNRTREIRPSGIVEGLQETWPVGKSMRRARLISISTESRRPRVMRWRPARAQRSVDRGARGPAIEPRKLHCPGRRRGRRCGRQHRWRRYRESSAGPAWSENPCTCAISSCREPGDLAFALA